MRKGFFAILMASILFPSSVLRAQALPKAHGHEQKISRKEPARLRKLKQRVLFSQFEDIRVTLKNGSQWDGWVGSVSDEGFKLLYARMVRFPGGRKAVHKWHGRRLLTAGRQMEFSEVKVVGSVPMHAFEQSAAGLIMGFWVGLLAPLTVPVLLSGRGLDD